MSAKNNLRRPLTVFTASRTVKPDKTSVRRFILLGGFLGAGKPTCLVRLAEWLRGRGLQPGIITNDQGEGLADTAAARQSQNAVKQITGGCFCCRSGELRAALEELGQSARPDVFVAEPVGSCTDLVATVLLPLRQVYKLGMLLAPMSVVLDGKRAWQNYFGKARTGGGFSKDVRYIYLKQMEEAEILVVNKADLLSEGERKRLTARLMEDFPGKRVLEISAREGRGLEAWFSLLLEEESRPEQIMEVDYAQYGTGEAQLGWYNARLRLEAPRRLDGNALLLRLAMRIQRRMETAGIEIAHFKMSLAEGSSADAADAVETGLAVVNAVRSGSAAECSSRLASLVAAGEVLINLRAEGDPDVLKAIVEVEIRGLPLVWEESAAFRPSMPRPVHRAVAV